MYAGGRRVTPKQRLVAAYAAMLSALAVLLGIRRKVDGDMLADLRAARQQSVRGDAATATAFPRGIDLWLARASAGLARRAAPSHEAVTNWTAPRTGVRPVADPPRRRPAGRHVGGLSDVPRRRCRRHHGFSGGGGDGGSERFIRRDYLLAKA